MLVRSRRCHTASIAEAPPRGLVETDLWNFVGDRRVRKNRTALSSTYFSLDYPGCNLTEHEWVKSADILNLHWVSDFQSPTSLAALLSLGKPVVWTLHDLRAFTGGCHFPAGCRGYETDCFPCPQLQRDRLALTRRNVADQRESYSMNPPVLVSPSRWLAECARRSAVFKDVEIEVIPYGTEAGAFHPEQRSEARRQLGIPDAAFCMAFGAHYLSEKRKGAAELGAALQAFAARRGDEKAILLAFGRYSGGVAYPGIEVRSLGYLRDEVEIRRAYSAADVFVLPSLEDNLPNTMLEALACGTPVAAFAVGGIPDVIRDGVNGRLVPVGDVAALAKALGDFAKDRAGCARMGAEGARLIAAEHTLAVQAERYAALYRRLSPVPARSIPARRFGRRMSTIVPALVAEWAVFSGVRQHWALLQRMLSERPVKRRD